MRKPAILDAVEDVIGPDFLVWGASFFNKAPGSPDFVSWHQDATYWGLEPPDIVTAWVASRRRRSRAAACGWCPAAIAGRSSRTRTLTPGQHAEPRPGDRGRGRDEEVSDVVLAPGQMSLHHVLIAHGSSPTGRAIRASASRSATSAAMSARPRRATTPPRWCAAASTSRASSSSRHRAASSIPPISNARPPHGRRAASARAHAAAGGPAEPSMKITDIRCWLVEGEHPATRSAGEGRPARATAPPPTRSRSTRSSASIPTRASTAPCACRSAPRS